MQNIVWKLLLIVAVLGLCLLTIKFKWPPRLGKDLRGGVSLIYNVNIPAGTPNPEDVLNRTISVLKERVNPKGVYDISMQPLGRDRIEVVMPLPNEEVRQLDLAFKAALADLLAQSEIRTTILDDVLRRGVAPEELGGDPASERGAKIAALQTAYQERIDTRAAFDAATEQGATQEEIIPLANAAAAADLSYERLYDEVRQLSLSEGRVRRTLNLPTQRTKARDEEGKVQLDEKGKPVEVPSQRETAVGQIKADFPDLAARFDAAAQAYDTYDEQRTGFDDPEDLIRLLRGAGVLQFHIAVSASQPEGIDVDDLRAQLVERGAENTLSLRAKWFPINQLRQWYDEPRELALLEADPISYFAGRDLVAGVTEGRYYLLLWSTDARSMTHQPGSDWALADSYPTSDRLGRPAVSFVLDAGGSGMMGRLTGANIGRPMAIVLDGEVYSAPTIQSAISKNGIITGSFSQEEISYLIRVLSAGSLQARLSSEPISINVIGPSIGADNLQRGREAFIISLIAVAAFMIFYYFFAGFVADLALIANGIIIFGAMMAIDGTFTLPGLAGIVLTIGMAVDANVLIYERIREEIMDDDLDLRSAIRQGYRKALSTILDANITNLIVCLVLFQTATTEVKGFALTLTIGICATLFTALFVTRQIYYLYTDLVKIDKLPMLPTVIPAIHRALEPSINWIGLRKIFWAMSAVALLISVILVWSRGVNMFDTEFRGGVSATMRTTLTGQDADGDGEPDRLMLRQTGVQDAVEDTIFAIGAAADPTAATTDEERTSLAILRELAEASVLTVGETSTDAEGNVIASEFQVKVPSPKGLDDEQTISAVVVQAIIGAFGDKLEVTPPLEFRGAGTADHSDYVFPIQKEELAASIQGRPDLTHRVPEFKGGAAILLSDVVPPVTVEDLEQRIEKMRRQPDFAAASGRKVKVLGVTEAAEPAKGFSELVVLVYDEYRDYAVVDTEIWYNDVADLEWSLINQALRQPASLQQVNSFSSAVAQTLSAQAVVAVVLTLLGILVYIWVRFGSLRYSLAAIVALVHDVTIALGLLAFSGLIGGTAIGAKLLIVPFRIDLGVVAALLTIIGYSLNDTIVILDRIRENRGKLPLPTAPIVNRSINQTFSRTLLTTVTTLMAVLIMYAEGGSGIRPFTFCLLIGLVVGTYSSIAIAAPLVHSHGSGSGAAAGVTETGAKPQLT